MAEAAAVALAAAAAAAVVAAVAAVGRCSTRTEGNGFLPRTADEFRDADSRVDRALGGLYSVR